MTSTATDVAGNQSHGESVSFNLDTVDPRQPSIDSWAEDTNIGSDGVTYDDVLTLNVSGEAGGTPTVYLDGTTVVASSFVDNGDGTYVVTTDPLANGLAGNLQATITDVAGNESVLSGPVTVSIDTAASAKPVITFSHPRHERRGRRCDA